jgi:predicted double-glycine peptidase
MKRKQIAFELLRVARVLLAEDAQTDKVDKVDLLETPDIRQAFNFDCGANATQLVLVYYGKDVTAGELMEDLKTTEEGTNVVEMVRVLKEHGLDVRAGEMTLDSLKEALDNKWPVIIPLQAWNDNPTTIDWKTEWEDGHYVTAVGYEDDRIYFEDPAIFENVYLTEAELLDRWHDKDVDGKIYRNYGIVVAGTPKYDDSRAVHMD